MIRERAPAKINLVLHVRGRRADGYHELETLFAFARDGDVVSVARAAANRFAITGPFARALSPGDAADGANAWGDNLVTAAADAFARVFAGTGTHAITLEKNLPVASGIGGGSADAAATLRALAAVHGVAHDDARLASIAETLGADVPACLFGRTTFGAGKGERLDAIDGLPGTPLLLVNPGVAVSTGAVFARWDGVDRGGIAQGDLLTRARAGRNDLEPAARGIAPVIAEVRAVLDAGEGVLLSRMSGSGATCFALFEQRAQCAAVAAAARRRGWWCLETILT